MKKIFSIDRIEGELAICVSDDGDVVEVPQDALCGMGARDVFCAELEDGQISGAEPMPEERDRRLERNKKRLHDLARRGKR